MGTFLHVVLDVLDVVLDVLNVLLIAVYSCHHPLVSVSSSLTPPPCVHREVTRKKKKKFKLNILNYLLED